MPLLDPIPSPVAYADFAALEWDPLLALVAGFAASPVGRAAILALQPSTDDAWITHQHRLTGEVRLLIEEQISIPLGGLFDPTQLADKARIPEVALEAVELQAVARLAHDIASWQSLLREPPPRVAGRLPGLSELSMNLSGSLRPLAGVPNDRSSSLGWLETWECGGGGTSPLYTQHLGANGKRRSAVEGNCSCPPAVGDF
jgi:DNA mismatch repair protein MutS2